MNTLQKSLRAVTIIGTLALLLGVQGYSQVGPAEIANPRLKASEQAYLNQLIEVNRAIARLSFPFGFRLSRYAGLDPKDQVGADTRGLEFVNFHDRLVLKLTGNYNAAYDADLLTPNQRANRVFDDVVVPALRLLQSHFSPSASFDAFGFEIAYHARRRTHGYGYEGKEILVAVLDKADALRYSGEKNDPKEQGILNRSEIYLNGEPFGLALGVRDPFDVEALERSVRHRPAMASEEAFKPTGSDGQAAPAVDYGQAIFQKPLSKPPQPQAPENPVVNSTRAAQVATPPKTKIEDLQKNYQLQLDELALEGAAKYHFVDYAPPSFVIFRNQLALQLTLRNPDSFDKETTSIYKRAAQSFDLFLALELKPILDKIPESREFGSLDVTILNDLVSKSGKASEALEFVFPLQPLRQFVAAEITNQELINQSVVLVNGVRVALNLQQVE